MLRSRATPKGSEGGYAQKILDIKVNIFYTNKRKKIIFIDEKPFMTIKDLIRLTKHFPADAKIELTPASDSASQDNFTLQLVYDSDKGWVVKIVFK